MGTARGQQRVIIFVHYDGGVIRWRYLSSGFVLFSSVSSLIEIVLIKFRSMYASSDLMQKKEGEKEMHTFAAYLLPRFQ